MYSLVIDTSTKFLYIALVNDNNILDEIVFEGKKDHAANSVYKINEVLEKNNLEVKDLDRIYCGFGPGSYTGVRIAVTIAKMISSFTNVKLYEVSSLYLMSSGYDNKNVCPMIDARRGNYFSACYGENEIVDKLRNKEEFLNEVQGFSDLKIVYEDDFKVNPLKVIKRGVLVENPHAFVPNYLRISEAEYNLEHKND